MANEVNIYTPRYLAEVVRQAPPVHTFFRDTFFTNVKKSTTDRVDIDLVKGDRRMAAFVHPRVGGKVLKASGYKTESYKPPLVNPCDITTADRYMTRMPGEDLYSGETPAQRSAQQLMEEYSRLNDATTRREEWMAVQAIVTGQVPVVGEGVNEIIDFGFTNTETLTGTAQWGKPQPEQGGSGTPDGGGQVVFAPQIVVQGNADRAVLESVLDDAQQRFELWYEQMMRRKARTAY